MRKLRCISPRTNLQRRCAGEGALEKCRRIGEMPRIGVARPEVRPELRTLPFGNYLIVYREIEGGAEIVTVTHGASRWQDLLRP